MTNSRHGIKHVQFTTKDLPATRAFWNGILGFPILLQDEQPIGDGGSLPREIYDVGNRSYVIFLDISGHPQYSKTVDTTLYSDQKRPSMAYHFAFNVGSIDQLIAKHEYLKSRGVALSSLSFMISWAATLYFPDPVNGIQLEYTCVHYIPGAPEDLVRGFREAPEDKWLKYLDIELNPENEHKLPPLAQAVS